MVNLYLRTAEKGKAVFKRASTRKQALEGTYYLRYEAGGKRFWKKAGESLQGAMVALRSKEIALLKGEAEAPKPSKPQELTLGQHQEKFLEFKKTTAKKDGTPLDKETLDAYEQQVGEFLAVCRHTSPEEVDGQDLRRYMAALRGRGKSHRTIVNNYTSIATFLKFCGVDHKKLLPYNERPTPDDGTPESYTEEEIRKFFAALVDERDILAFELLLKSGLRLREMATLEAGDFAFGAKPTVTVQPRKQHLRFRTKTGKGRTVPLEKPLAMRLEAWILKNPGKRLVFGTKAGKEERHFYRICRETAKRAGMDPDKFWIHKWRATFCTMSLQRGFDIRTVQAMAGHTSITMTERYLSPAKGERVQELINQAFSWFSPEQRAGAHIN